MIANFGADTGCHTSEHVPLRHVFSRVGCAAPLLAIFLSSVAAAFTPTSDPLGDTFGVGPVQHDIIAVRTALTGGELTFEIEFNAEVSPPSAFQQNVVAGFIDLDLDSNPGTGAMSHVTQLGQEPSSLGVEFFVDLFSEGDAFLSDGMTPRTPGQVDFVDTSSVTTTAILSADYGPRSLSVSIPRSLLTGMVLPIPWGVVVGTLDEATDKVLGSTIPEPAAALLLIVAAAANIFGPLSRERRSTPGSVETRPRAKRTNRAPFLHRTGSRR